MAKKKASTVQARVGEIEAQLKFIMDFIKVHKQEGTINPVVVTKSVRDLYLEHKAGIERVTHG
jgi:hypothetical protein